jgi:acetoacetyl-CoA synthetase
MAAAVIFIFRIAKHLDVWAHGDFALIHPITKQLIFLGRTDGVLNPSGVRFGSADIYRVIESKFSAEIKDSLCVGQKRDGDSDERVMLFLLMKPGIPFTPSIVEEVKACIRADLSPRHVPTFIFQTQEIPVRISVPCVQI